MAGDDFGLTVNDIANSERADGGELSSLFWEDWHIEINRVGNTCWMSLYVRCDVDRYVLIRQVAGQHRRLGMRSGELQWLR